MRKLRQNRIEREKIGTIFEWGKIDGFRKRWHLSSVSGSEICGTWCCGKGITQKRCDYSLIFFKYIAKKIFLPYNKNKNEKVEKQK